MMIIIILIFKIRRGVHFVFTENVKSIRNCYFHGRRGEGGRGNGEAWGGKLKKRRESVGKNGKVFSPVKMREKNFPIHRCLSFWEY